MRYLKITRLDSSTGNILSAVDADTGRTVDVHKTVFRVRYTVGDSIEENRIFSTLIPAALAGYSAPGQPDGMVVRVKICDYSGNGRFLDIAGEGARDEANKIIFYKLLSPEFWYMDAPTATRYGCL